MKIPAKLQTLLPVAQREVPSLLKQLNVGQILSAKVLTQLQPSLVRLRIATTEMIARTPLQFEPGDKLKLQVASKQPLPELRILREPTRLEQHQRTLRTALARQLPPADSRQLATQLRATSSNTNPEQADAMRRFESIVRDASLRPERLNAAQIKRVLLNSGIFHEARLLGAVPTTGEDVKARLLQLLATLNGSVTTQQRAKPQPEQAGDDTQPKRPAGEPLLSRLIRLVEGSVARIQMQQTAALPVEEGNRQAWQIDLPMTLPDSTDDIMLRIERDGGDDGDGNGGPTWSIKLVFDFDTIGKLQCRIGLNGDRVTTAFWCDHVVTHERLEQRLPVLAQAFEAQGLEVVHLSGSLGEPAEAMMHVPRHDKLLDERA